MAVNSKLKSRGENAQGLLRQDNTKALKTPITSEEETEEIGMVADTVMNFIRDRESVGTKDLCTEEAEITTHLLVNRDLDLLIIIRVDRIIGQILLECFGEVKDWIFLECS